MNSNPTSPKKISTVPLAVLQVVAAVLLALISRAGNPYVGAIGVTVIAAAFALQILISRSYWYFISMALCLSFSFLIGGVAPFGMSVCALFAGILLASMIKKKQTKISVSLALTILYIVFFALVFLAVYLLGGNEFSVSAILGYFSDKVDSVKEILIAGSQEYVDLLLQNGSMTAEEGNKALALYAQSFGILADYVKLMLPSFFIACTEILGYLTACVFKLCTKISGCDILLPDPRWETLPSMPCAWVYIASYLVYFAALFFSNSTSVIEIAASSIITILSPVMFLMGLKWIAAKPNKGFIIIAFVVSFMFIGPITLIILSFFGVREIFRRREFMKKTEQKK